MDLSNINIEKELQIVFMGTPSFAVPILEGLIDNYKVRAGKVIVVKLNILQ